MLFSEIKYIITSANKRELRKFGITIGFFLVAVTVFFFWKDKTFTQYIACTGAVFFFLGLTLPIILKPIFIVWMIFAVIMGFIMTRVILSLIFFLIFTPVGLIIRLIGKDPLQERIDHKVKTYWIKKEKTIFDPQSAENQY